MERGEGVLAHGLEWAPKESPRSGKPRAKLWCPRGRSCSRVDTALRGEVGAGRRRVPTVATSLPRSEPSRRLREARWQRSVSQKTTPTWVDSHGVAWTPSRFARDGNLEDVLCKTHSDRRIFHSDSSFFDAFFRLTLAHRCRLCQRRSPSHHLMAEAPCFIGFLRRHGVHQRQ